MPILIASLDNINTNPSSTNLRGRRRHVRTGQEEGFYFWRERLVELMEAFERPVGGGK